MKTLRLSSLLAAAAAFLAALFASPARSEATAGWKLDPRPSSWKARGFLESMDLSGLASIDGRHCLVASDELRAVQAGQIDREEGLITAGPVVTLTDNAGGKRMELDLEAVTASSDGRFYYAAGSHGVGKKKGDVQPDRFAVFQIPVDAATGAVGTGEIRRASLRPWLERSREFGRFVGQPLQQNGFNIEGLAYAQDRLWFGVRGPNVKGTGYVIETDAQALFSGGEIECVVHALPLGEARGVRDLAGCRDGFLLVTGNASAEATKKFPVSEVRSPDARFELVLWRPGATPALTWLGELPSAPGKAEALMVLEETAEHIDLLCLFDGVAEGGPAAYRLWKPAGAAGKTSLTR